MATKVLSRQTDAPIALGIAAVAVVVYLPAVWMGFTADDFFILARVKQLGGLAQPFAYFGPLGFFEYYRPLTFLSHALDWELWQMQPAGFHLTNVLLHALNTILVFTLGRRLAGRTPAILAALLFAVHPVSHEAVYWISARFDLLATCLALVSLVMVSGRPRGYPFGVMAFGLALLAKESALAVPVIAVAYDVLIRRLEWRQAAWRLLPFLLVIAVYALLRSHGGALDPSGGAARIPKLLILATMIAALLGVAWARRLGAWGDLVQMIDVRTRNLAILTFAAGVLVAAMLLVPATSVWVREKIGFASFSLFYLLSPISVPAPPPQFFDRPAVPTAAIELAALCALVALAWSARRRVARHPELVFLLAFIVAALAPVSSMTSGPRYLYLASPSVCLLVATLFTALPRAVRTRGVVALALVLTSFVVQAFVAGRSWKWASDMTHAALFLMNSKLGPCGTQDVIVLTTPVGIRGVYSNLNEVAFEVAGCRPASFRTLFRVMRKDTHVEVTRTGDLIEMRVPSYDDNFVASHDLRSFDRPIVGQEAVSIDTPVGQIESVADGTGRVFRLRLAERYAGAHLYFYSDGALHALD